MKSDIEKTIRRWKLKRFFSFAKYNDRVHLWEKIGKHPLDKLYIELTQIYLEAKPDERRVIENAVTKNRSIQRQLLIFVRRLAKLIKSKNQLDIVRYGLIGAAIEDKHYDSRDTIISLVILKYAADKVGIDTSALIDEISPIAPPNMSDIYENVKTHPHSSVLHTIKTFGPHDWADRI